MSYSKNKSANNGASLPPGTSPRGEVPAAYPFPKGRDKESEGKMDNKQEVVSISYEEIGFFPRSFSRVLDRFLKQVFSDVENLVIQEYRFYRYLFLTTLKCLLILFLVPLFVNFMAKTYVVRPLTEYFWNGKQTEIFLNSYQQKRAFAELKDFEEKLYFESLIYPKSAFGKDKSSLNLETSLTSHSGSSVDSITLSSTNLSNSSLRTTLSQTSGPSGLPGSVKMEEIVLISPLNLDKNETGGLPLSSVNSFTNNISIGMEDSTLSKGNGALPLRVGTPINSYSKNSANNGEEQLTLVKSESFLNKTKEGVIEQRREDEKTESLINAYTLKSSLFVYQTIEADKNIQQRYQEKTVELAQRYNDQSIEAITNFFADLISLLTLFYLLYALEIQINITKSFLLEVFFGLDDSKKSLLILLVTDLLVGYHSSNLWELFFEFLFNHYGLPESQTGIFLLVATLPVLLDVLFKYLIFRHLNRSSPATVATYHAMIE